MFVQRIRDAFSSTIASRIISGLKVQRRTTFRVNLLKASPEEVERALRMENIKFARVKFPPNAYYLTGSSLKELQSTRVYRDGLIYVQSFSSMLPPLVLSPLPGETVLDLGAAPGSKTTQMCAMMRNEGKIVAVEKNKIRYYKLKANISRQGCSIVKPVLRDGSYLPASYRDCFDKVLLDAPCSGEGTFQESDPSSYAYWSVGKVHHWSWVQKKLFKSAYLALKKGGILVYSTCTISPEENELVVAWALSQFRKLELVPVDLSIFKGARVRLLRGLKTVYGEPLPEEIAGTLRILPDEFWEGFFIAKFRKA